MEENKNDYQLEEPINDLPSYEEIGENPFYDDDFAQVALNVIDNNNQQYQNNNVLTQNDSGCLDTPQIVNQEYQ